MVFADTTAARCQAARRRELETELAEAKGALNRNASLAAKEIKRSQEASEKANSMLAKKDEELRELESKHKKELQESKEASEKAMSSALAKKDGERKYDERRYAEHGGTLSIGDVEQLKDELKKEKAQHEQTKQDLEKAQTKISAMSALLANDEPSGGGAEGSSGNDTAGGAKGEPDLTKETGTVKHLMAVSPWLSLRNPRGRRGFCCRQVISEMHA